MFLYTYTSSSCDAKSQLISKYSWLKWILIPMLLMPLTGTSAASPSVAQGKAIAGQCAVCHGNDGKAVNTSYPNLAGQNYQYLLDQLKNFKTGQRNNAIMQSIASGLTEQQMEDLAAYYANIPIAECAQK